MHRTRLSRIAAAAVVSALVLVGLVAVPAQAATSPLGDPGTYGGQVFVGNSSTPVGEAEATVSLDTYVNGVRTPIAGASASTDSSGNYLITGLPSVSIYPRVHYNGTGPYVTDTVEQNVIGGPGNRIYNPVLKTAYHFSGHVDISTTGATTGTAAGNHEVEVKLRWTSGSGALQTTWTDANGDYSFDRVAYSGQQPTVFLEFVTHTGVSYPVWYENGDGIGGREASISRKVQLTEDRVADVVIGAGSGVAGTIVRSDGQPVPGMTVTVTAYTPDGHGGGTFVKSYAADVDATGGYRAIGLDPQYIYGVLWHAPGYSYGRNDGGDFRRFHGFVDVEANTISTGNDGVLYENGVLQVTVIKGWDIPPFYDTPARAYLLSYDETDDTWDQYGQYSSDTTGHIDFPWLNPGYYSVITVYGVNQIQSRVFEVGEGEAVPYMTSMYAAGNVNNIYTQYQALGGADGPLGQGLTGASYGGSFEGGNIYTSSFGTWIVWKGPILETYLATGGQTGTYGWPIGDEECDGDLCSQRFQKGVIAPVPMAQLTAPTLSGSYVVGGAVVAAPGTYSPAATSFRYEWLRDGAVVSGATSARYMPTVDDFGHTLQARVTALRVGRIPVTSVTTASPQIGAGTLASAPVPTIAGVVKVGSTLTVKPGAWRAGTTFTYQWSANGIAIAGATDPSLVLPAGVVGKKITVTVIGTATGYSPASKTSAASIPVAPTAFLTSAVPVIVGTPQVGVTLSVDTGTWSPAATFRYQWYANGVAIKGAVGATFTPTGARLGKRISVAVIGSAPGYIALSRLSARTGLVARGEWGTTPVPVVDDDDVARVGVPVTANTSGWKAGATFAYQWYANNVAISGATKATFIPTASQLTKTLSVRITTTTSGYPVVVLKSAPSAPVAVGVFTSTPTPTITGTVRYGDVLTARPGVWSPAPTAYTYQWSANGTPLTGATASTFKVPLALLGQQITVTVKASRAGFTGAQAESAPTVPVVGRPFSKAPVPIVAGLARVGTTLVAKPGTWSPVATFAYQWFADGEPITDATAASFRLPAEVAGARITVRVTGTAAGYVTVSQTSVQTAVVAPAP